MSGQMNKHIVETYKQNKHIVKHIVNFHIVNIFPPKHILMPCYRWTSESGPTRAAQPRTDQHNSLQAVPECLTFRPSLKQFRTPVCQQVLHLYMDFIPQLGNLKLDRFDEIWTVRVASYVWSSLVSGLFHRNLQMPGHSTFAMKSRESSVTVNSSIRANPTSNYGFASVFAHSVVVSSYISHRLRNGLPPRDDIRLHYKFAS